MMLSDIKSGKFDIEGCPIKSDALYEYVNSVEDPEIINNTQGFVYTYPNRIFAHFDVDLNCNRIKPCSCSNNKSNRRFRRRGHSMFTIPTMHCT